MKILRWLTATLPGDEPPTELLIWPFGQVDTLKGVFEFSRADGASVLQAFADYGNELAFDYEHQAVKTVGDTPAAGWFGLEMRADGLWAVNIRWTANADARIRAKEYRYFSPTFYTNEDGHITELFNIALTNQPATKNMTPLVAASALDRRAGAIATGALSFNDISASLYQALQVQFGQSAWVCEVYDDRAIFEMGGRSYQVPYRLDGTRAVLTGDAVEVKRAYQPVDGGSTMKTLLKALGLADTATEAEAMVALTGVMAQAAGAKKLVALTGKGTDDEALGVVTSWQASAGQVVTLSARVRELEGQLATGEVDTLLAEAQKAGKIAPAQVETLKALGKDNPTALKAFIEAAPVLVTPAGGHQPPGSPPGGGDTITLSREEQELCKQMGTKPEDLIAHKKKQAAAAGQ